MTTSPDVSQPTSSADSVTDGPIPSLDVEDRFLETAVIMKPHHGHHRRQNTIESPYACTYKAKLPAACFLRTSYDRLCASLSEVICRDADTSHKVLLPTKESLNIFIESYFENFCPLFPILSLVGFKADMEHPLLVFCVCTIGVSFLAETRLQTLYSMSSLLRKNLDSIVSATSWLLCA